MKSKIFCRCFVYSAVIALSLVSFSLSAQTSDTQANDRQANDRQAKDRQANDHQSWTATTESKPSDANPTRTTQTHKENGNRTIDTQSVQRLGPEGRYEPYYDIETESVRVNDTTTKTITRTFARDANGQKSLTQVTEEDKESLPGGGEKMVRATKNPDLEGHLSIVQREVSDTRKTGPNPQDQETKTTVFLPDASGSLAPSVQTIERKKRSGEQTTEVQKSTLLPDGSGRWQVRELKESTTKTKEDSEKVKGSTTEERVFRPGLDGALSVSSSTISKESETPNGERHSSVQTYSTDVTGSVSDGSLHLSRQDTTVRLKHPDGGQSSVEQIRQPDPSASGGGLQVIQVVSTDDSGNQQTRTIQARDSAGDLQVISVEIKKSDQPRAVQAPPAQENKPENKEAKKDTKDKK